MNLPQTHRLLLPLLVLVGLAGTLVYYFPRTHQDQVSQTAVPTQSLTAASALLPSLQITPTFTPIATWPVSDQEIDYLADLDSYVAGNASYMANAAGGQIITSVRVNNTAAGFSYKPQTALPALYATYKANNPNTLIGSYISGGDCLFPEAVRYYYSEAVSCAEILAEVANVKDVLLPYQGIPNELRRRVNIANPMVRKVFANLLVAEGISRGLPFLYLDNIMHPSTGAFRNTAITFDDQIDLITQVRSALEARGIRAVFNIALSPAGLTGDYVADAAKMRVAAGRGGYSFEMPLHPNIRNKAGDIAREISVFRQWLDADQLVLLVPAFSWATLEDRLADLQLVAAYGMMVKLERHSPLFVSRLGYWLTRDTFPWADWPEQLGDPVGDYRFVSLNPVIMERHFANGVLSMEPATRRVSVEFYDRATPDRLSDLDVSGAVVIRPETEAENLVSELGRTSPHPTVPPVDQTRAADAIGGAIVVIPNKTLTISYGASQTAIHAPIPGLAPTVGAGDIKAAVGRISSILTDLIVYLQTAKKLDQKPDYNKVASLLDQIIKVLNEVKRYNK